MVLTNISPWLVAVALGVVATVFICLVWLFILQQNQGRWQAQCARYQKLAAQGLDTIKAEESGFFSALGVCYPVSARERQRLLQMLEQAGIYSPAALNSVRGAKLFLGIVVSLLAIGWQWSQEELVSAFSLMLVLVGYVLGSNLPEYWLRRQSGQARQR